MTMAGAANNRPSRRRKASAEDEKAGGERLFDRELEALPPDLRWREWMLRVEAVIFAAGAPYTYVTTKHFLSAFGMETLRDLPDIGALEDAGLLSRQAVQEEVMVSEMEGEEE